MSRLSRTALVAVVGAGLCALGLPLASGAAAAPVADSGLADSGLADSGLVRMVHLSPDTPAVDATVDAVSEPDVEVVLPAVGYGDVSPYQRVPAGTYTVSARAAGADPGSPPVLSTTVTVAPGSATTVAGVGLFADLGLAVLTDDLTLPPAGSARARVVNAASTGSPVDVALGGGTVLATDLAFADSADAVDVPGGVGTLVVTGADGTSDELPVDLAAGSVHTVLVLDREGGGRTVTTTLDAAGPGVVPVGGVEAGGGGTAADGGLPVGRTALAVLSLTALLLAVGVRRPRRGHTPPSPTP